MIKPETKQRWRRLYEENTVIVYGGTLLTGLLASLALIQSTTPHAVEKPTPTSNGTPVLDRSNVPPMHKLKEPRFLWSDYRYKTGMDVFIENGRGVDCGPSSAPRRDGKSTGLPPIRVDSLWPGFKFTAGTSNFGEFRNGDRLIFLGQENAIGNDGDQFLTNGWAVEFYKKQDKYQIMNFVVKKAEDFSVPASTGDKTIAEPWADAFADAETGMLTKHQLEEKPFYNDEHTMLFVQMGHIASGPTPHHKRPEEPRFTVACNQNVTPVPTTTSF